MHRGLQAVNAFMRKSAREKQPSHRWELWSGSARSRVPLRKVIPPSALPSSTHTNCDCDAHNDSAS
eukprot:m.12840 g.12840  ORF g.12840 m.12840 type:complete len:66 (-) comp18047_c0_seq1:408-605(-)